MHDTYNNKSHSLVNSNANLYLGAPPANPDEFETHVVQFERYVKMPAEYIELKEKLNKQREKDPELRLKMREEELVNPWLVTELDLCGNPHAKED